MVHGLYATIEASEQNNVADDTIDRPLINKKNQNMDRDEAANPAHNILSRSKND